MKNEAQSQLQCCIPAEIRMNKKSKIIILFFCALTLSLHLIADYHSGFHSDEFLYIESGHHLAFGYMEIPPLLGVLAFIQNLFHSTSVFIYHISPHIAMLLMVIYIGKITTALGGKKIAVFITLFCFLISPGFRGSQQLFEPVVFSQLFWLLSFYQLTKFVKHGSRKHLWYLAILIALFFLTKYVALFFCFGLLSLWFFKKIRITLIKSRFWQCLIVSFLIVLPNIIWQYANDWPALQMFQRLYETQLDNLTFLEVLHNLFLSINPIAFILILPAFIFVFVDKKNKSLYLPLGLSILLSILLLSFSKGKAYYFFPIALTLLPFCGVFWERLIQPKRKWLLYPLSLMLLIGTLLIPFGLPVFSFPQYLNSVYKYTPKEKKNGKEVLPIQAYSTKEEWKTTMQQLQSVYDSLPADEKRNSLIWGKHYSQAGAVELFKDNYDLPNAFSYHGSFYTWAPSGKMPNTVIAFCYNDTSNHFFDPFIITKTNCTFP